MDNAVETSDTCKLLIILGIPDPLSALQRKKKAEDEAEDEDDLTYGI